jgi:hypothetical protein
MLVIVPSRGRPKNIAELFVSWYETGADATLVVAVDDDDPELPAYRALFDVAHDPRYQLVVGPRLRLAGTLNAIAHERVNRVGALPFDIIGFMGDDHRPRTAQWDVAIENTFADMGHGIVYGNDLIQGPNLPTAVWMTAGMIKTMGYMVPPGFIHMYLDNVWKEWGMRMDRMFYLPNVVIEHMHPIAGKAEWDDRYVEVNDGAIYAADETAFKNYLNTRITYDIERLRDLMMNG